MAQGAGFSVWRCSVPGFGLVGLTRGALAVIYPHLWLWSGE